MTEKERAALKAFAADMATAFTKLAASFDDVGAAVESGPSFSAANMDMDWNERVLRHALILQEIVSRGGSVPHSIWLEIAERYGYEGRGLAGFFRKGGGGLLELRVNGSKKTVYVTKRGRDRLKQNQERVDRTLAQVATEVDGAGPRPTAGLLAVPFAAGS